MQVRLLLCHLLIVDNGDSRGTCNGKIAIRVINTNITRNIQIK